MTSTATQHAFLAELGITAENQGAYNGTWMDCTGDLLESRSPATGELIATIRQATAAEYDIVVESAQADFLRWRALPAPARGEIVRKMGNAIREKKDALGRLIALEMGKILQEGLGEVQEAIDISDFAVGLSRQLYGLTMPSERPGHAMREQWHPLGVVGCVTAFNFPMAVWAWNGMLAYVCGDAMLWKPSSQTPLCAIGMTNVVRPVLEAEGFGALAGLVIGPGRAVGQRMLEDPKLPLISFTGSTNIGRSVAATVSPRFGRTILELGGNNAVVVMKDADIDMAIPAIVFGAVGTAGQRCTSTRRVLVHEDIADDLCKRLLAAYSQVNIGNPMNDDTLCGPLISKSAVDEMLESIEDVKKAGGTILCGGGVATMEGDEAGGNFVLPTIARVENEWDVVQRETFAPLLYIITVKDIDDAIAKHNGVPQGLSSSIFTMSIRDAERFISGVGSDCGIANVNIGTSGAEIGGAFGGEKETGGGRESGSDAWKVYMRRQTNTVNWSDELPLAQGIKFG
jgi:aldehyde dehydrogenase (NAD+)